MRQEGSRLPAVGDIAEMKVGSSIAARLRFTETATRFGGLRLWMLCPRCSRRCRVLFIGFGRVACRRCFRLPSQPQSLDQMDRALHAMGKIARQIDPHAAMDFPGKPPGMHWTKYNRLAERLRPVRPPSALSIKATSGR